MRVLLDRCLPKRLRDEFPGHEVIHASEVPWGQSSNGELVKQASDSKFDALITIDQNMRFQTRIDHLQLCVVVVTARDNRLDTLKPTCPRILQLLDHLQPGEYVATD